MKPAFVILFAVLLLVPAHRGVSREETPSVGDVAISQASALGNFRDPGEQQSIRKAQANACTLLGSLPLYFVENRGQADQRVKFDAKIRNGKVYLTPEGIVYQFLLGEKGLDIKPREPFPTDSLTATGNGLPRRASPGREETIRVSFVGANNEARLEGQEEQEAKFNYFRGSDPGKWVSAAPSFKKVVYRDLYPGVDLVVSGQKGKIKGEYVVRPGSDPETICLKYDGAKALRVNAKGQLEIQTSSGMLIEDVPTSYQLSAGTKRAVKAGYHIAADDTVRFQVGAYRRNADLVIDPLAFSTFLGGNSSDQGNAITMDVLGNTYVVGYTWSSDFPTTGGAFDESYNGLADVFISKVTSTGNMVLYSTFLGGSGEDRGYGIGLDGVGNIFVTGVTTSSDFPTTAGAFDTGFNGAGDVFITKLNSSGSTLLYSTFLGGSADDFSMGLKVDGSGAVYVTGFTASTAFPTTAGAFDTSHNGGWDAIITKLNSSGSALLYSTFLGGSNTDQAGGIAVDGNGNAAVSGYTASTAFPTTAGAFDTSYSGGAQDAFVTELNSSGSALLYSTFLGGSNTDQASGIAVDGNGNAIISGYTYSTDFPTTAGAFDTSQDGGTQDAFITRLNASGSALLYSTFLGGSGNEMGYQVGLDSSGNAYVSGYTSSSDFPTTSGAYDTSYNGGTSDAFISKLNSSGSALLYSTFLGGAGSEYALGLFVDLYRHVYLTGTTDSADFPTTSGVFDMSYGGGYDSFVTKLATAYPDIRQPIANINFGSINVGGSSDQTTTIYNDGEAFLTVNTISRTSGSSEFTFVGPNLPFVLSAGGSQSVTVRFAPASAGAKSAVFNVNSDDLDTPNVTFSVSGTGVILTETVSTPSTPVGTTSGTIGTSYAFATGNSTSNLGHNVQYYFDWGDGTNTGWLSVGTFSAQKSWPSANTYNVTAKARCATHTAIESSTSSALAVNISAQGRDNSPSNYQDIPECIWAVATGGGTWASEVQITDITGGSVVSVYFNYGGGGNRRGPFTLWTGPAANYNVKYASILSTIDGLDAGAFDYYGRVGAVEFSTQDAAHKIMATARTLNGNYSKTFPGLNLTDSNTANTARRMVLQNFANNAAYRSSCGFFNPTADSVTMELRLIAENGDTIGSAFTKTLVGHDFQSFSPFNQAGVPYPTYAYDNVVLWITPTSGSGKVMIYGATANNTSNDPAAHIGVQYQ